MPTIADLASRYGLEDSEDEEEQPSVEAPSVEPTSGSKLDQLAAMYGLQGPADRASRMAEVQRRSEIEGEKIGRGTSPGIFATGGQGIRSALEWATGAGLSEEEYASLDPRARFGKEAIRRGLGIANLLFDIPTTAASGAVFAADELSKAEGVGDIPQALAMGAANTGLDFYNQIAEGAVMAFGPRGEAADLLPQETAGSVLSRAAGYKGDSAQDAAAAFDAILGLGTGVALGARSALKARSAAKAKAAADAAAAAKQKIDAQLAADALADVPELEAPSPPPARTKDDLISAIYEQLGDVDFAGKKIAAENKKAAQAVKRETDVVGDIFTRESVPEPNTPMVREMARREALREANPLNDPDVAVEILEAAGVPAEAFDAMAGFPEMRLPDPDVPRVPDADALPFDARAPKPKAEKAAPRKPTPDLNEKGEPIGGYRKHLAELQQERLRAEAAEKMAAKEAADKAAHDKAVAEGVEAEMRMATEDWNPIDTSDTEQVRVFMEEWDRALRTSDAAAMAGLLQRLPNPGDMKNPGFGTWIAGQNEQSRFQHKVGPTGSGDPLWIWIGKARGDIELDFKGGPRTKAPASSARPSSADAPSRARFDELDPTPGTDVFDLPEIRRSRAETEFEATMRREYAARLKERGIDPAVARRVVDELDAGDLAGELDADSTMIAGIVEAEVRQGRKPTPDVIRKAAAEAAAARWADEAPLGALVVEAMGGNSSLGIASGMGDPANGRAARAKLWKLAQQQGATTVDAFADLLAKEGAFSGVDPVRIRALAQAAMAESGVQANGVNAGALGAAEGMTAQEVAAKIDYENKLHERNIDPAASPSEQLAGANASGGPPVDPYSGGIIPGPGFVDLPDADAKAVGYSRWWTNPQNPIKLTFFPAATPLPVVLDRTSGGRMLVETLRRAADGNDITKKWMANGDSDISAEYGLPRGMPGLNKLLSNPVARKHSKHVVDYLAGRKTVPAHVKRALDADPDIRATARAIADLQAEATGLPIDKRLDDYTFPVAYEKKAALENLRKLRAEEAADLAKQTDPKAIKAAKDALAATDTKIAAMERWGEAPRHTGRFGDHQGMGTWKHHKARNRDFGNHITDLDQLARYWSAETGRKVMRNKHTKDVTQALDALGRYEDTPRGRQFKGNLVWDYYKNRWARVTEADYMLAERYVANAFGAGSGDALRRAQFEVGWGPHLEMLSPEVRSQLYRAVTTVQHKVWLAIRAAAATRNALSWAYNGLPYFGEAAWTAAAAKVTKHVLGARFGKGDPDIVMLQRRMGLGDVRADTLAPSKDYLRATIAQKVNAFDIHAWTEAGLHTIGATARMFQVNGMIKRLDGLRAAGRFKRGVTVGAAADALLPKHAADPARRFFVDARNYPYPEQAREIAAAWIAERYDGQKGALDNAKISTVRRTRDDVFFDYRDKSLAQQEEWTTRDATGYASWTPREVGFFRKLPGTAKVKFFLHPLVLGGVYAVPLFAFMEKLIPGFKETGDEIEQGKWGPSPQGLYKWFKRGALFHAVTGLEFPQNMDPLSPYSPAIMDKQPETVPGRMGKFLAEGTLAPGVAALAKLGIRGAEAFFGGGMPGLQAEAQEVGSGYMSPFGVVRDVQMASKPGLSPAERVQKMLVGGETKGERAFRKYTTGLRETTEDTIKRERAVGQLIAAKLDSEQIGNLDYVQGINDEYMDEIGAVNSRQLADIAGRQPTAMNRLIYAAQAATMSPKTWTTFKGWVDQAKSDMDSENPQVRSAALIVRSVLLPKMEHFLRKEAPTSKQREAMEQALAEVSADREALGLTEIRARRENNDLTVHESALSDWREIRGLPQDEWLPAFVERSKGREKQMMYLRYATSFIEEAGR